MDLGLSGKTALVCAASRGLGRAVAIELAREGCDVGICGRTESSVNETVEALQDVGTGRVVGCVTDVGDPAALDALVSFVSQSLGTMPNIVVWNAGGPPSGPLLDLPETALDEGIQLHMKGALHLFRATIPAMLEEGWGRVIAVTSVAVRQPLRNLGVSNGVRAGLHGILKTLALEVGASGVTVNAVLPGYTRTQRLEELAEVRASKENDTPANVLASFAASVPAGRLGERMNLLRPWASWPVSVRATSMVLLYPWTVVSVRGCFSRKGCVLV
jgi:3-oxoacyl-[acyl-carrier protein] reductase